MHGNVPFGVASARELQRQESQGTDKIVSPIFGKVAKAIWPFKTAFHLAAIADTSERVAARWLSGEHEPPGCVIAAVVVAITRRNRS